MSLPTRSDEPPYADIPDPLAGTATALGPNARPPRGRPTRSELKARARFALVLAVAWLAAELGWFGVRGDLARIPAASVVMLVVAPLGAALLCLAVALSSGRLGIGARVGLIALVAVVPPLALLAAVIRLSPLVSGGPPGSALETARCFNLTLSFAALPMLAAGVALRRTFVALPRLRSALVGSAAGLAGAALVNLHCERVGVAHVALGHVGAAVAVALLGAFLLARATRA